MTTNQDDGELTSRPISERAAIEIIISNLLEDHIDMYSQDRESSAALGADIETASTAIQALIATKCAEERIAAIRPFTPIALMDVEYEDDQYAMYWDDTSRVWNRARYKDLIEEAKRQMAATKDGTRIDV